MNHDSICVLAFEKIAIDYVKELLPHINKAIYFSDGCAAQYKNNVCHHEIDFGLTATWNFFATSQNKKCF